MEDLPANYPGLALKVTILLAGLLGFLGWDYYMKSTWDHHIVIDLEHYFLDKNEGREWVRLNEEDLEILSKKYNIPRKLEIIKKDDEYIWISNENKKLIKTVEGNAKKYNVYRTLDGSEYVKIWVNIYELGGCDNRHSIWGTGNLITYKTIENGDILKTSGHIYFYENIIQYIFCYEIRALPYYS